MARNRVIYQSEALFVSKDVASTGSGDHKQLERIQSANYSFNIARQDVNQYGQLAKLGSIILEPPTVSMDVSYLLTDGFNERALGFYVRTGSQSEGNFASGHMVTSSGRNIFIETVAEGLDNVSSPQTSGNIIGIGNAFLTNYSVDLAVGSLPIVNASFEASNINGAIPISGTGLFSSPAVNPVDGTSLNLSCVLPLATTGSSAEMALRPGDITLSLTGFDVFTISDLNPTADSIHIQSASLSLPLSRTPIQRLGSKFAYARAVDFPITATLSVSAIVNETTANSLSKMLTGDAGKDISLTIKSPTTANKDAIIYTLKNCYLDSESFSSSIGSNKTVDLQFSTAIGGPNDTTNGIFVSGANITPAF